MFNKLKITKKNAKHESNQTFFLILSMKNLFTYHRESKNIELSYNKTKQLLSFIKILLLSITYSTNKIKFFVKVQLE